MFKFANAQDHYDYLAAALGTQEILDAYQIPAQDFYKAASASADPTARYLAQALDYAYGVRDHAPAELQKTANLMRRAGGSSAEMLDKLRATIYDGPPSAPRSIADMGAFAPGRGVGDEAAARFGHDSVPANYAREASRGLARQADPPLPAFADAAAPPLPPQTIPNIDSQSDSIKFFQETWPGQYAHLSNPGLDTTPLRALERGPLRDDVPMPAPLLRVLHRGSPAGSTQTRFYSPGARNMGY